MQYSSTTNKGNDWLSRLRWIGMAEGFSWLLLLGIAMPLKYIWGRPEAVRLVGWVHGLLFVAYIIILAVVMVQKNWTYSKAFKGVIAAFLPFGTWIFDARLKEEQNKRPI